MVAKKFSVKFKRLEHSAGGFGLIEVLIAVAISTFVCLEMASTFKLMGASTNNLKGNIGAATLQGTLIQFISNPSNCMKHLQSITGFNGTQAQTAAGVPMSFKSDDGVTTIAGPAVPGGSPVPLPNYDVSVSSFVFQNATTTADPTTPGNLRYNGTLTLNLQKMAHSPQAVAGSRDLVPSSPPGVVTFSVTPTGTIGNCLYQPVDPKVACSALGGTWVQGNKVPCQIAPPCPPTELFLGFDSGNNPICKSSAILTTISCGVGQTAVSSGTGYICH